MSTEINGDELLDWLDEYYSINDNRYQDDRYQASWKHAIADIRQQVRALRDEVAMTKPPVRPEIMNPGVHERHNDDGVDYCGWAGDGGIFHGCGEPWPCSEAKRNRGIIGDWIRSGESFTH